MPRTKVSRSSRVETSDDEETTSKKQKRESGIKAAWFRSIRKLTARKLISMVRHMIGFKHRLIDRLVVHRNWITRAELRQVRRALLALLRRLGRKLVSVRLRVSFLPSDSYDERRDAISHGPYGPPGPVDDYDDDSDSDLPDTQIEVFVVPYEHCHITPEEAADLLDALAPLLGGKVTSELGDELRRFYGTTKDEEYCEDESTDSMTSAPLE